MEQAQCGGRGVKREGMLNLLGQEMVLETFPSVAAMFELQRGCVGENTGAFQGPFWPPICTRPFCCDLVLPRGSEAFIRVGCSTLWSETWVPVVLPG